MVLRGVIISLLCVITHLFSVPFYSYHTSSPGVMYPGYPAGIPVVPTTPGVGYPYVLGSPYVPVQLQQNVSAML